MEEGDEEEEDKKDENGCVEENSCEEGKIDFENVEEREKVRVMEEDQRKKQQLGRSSWEVEKRESEALMRSKLGGKWSKKGLKEEESTDRRSRSESDLLADLSRFIEYSLRKLEKLTQNYKYK